MKKMKLALFLVIIYISNLSYAQKSETNKNSEIMTTQIKNQPTVQGAVFELPKLKYEYADLEPHIDSRTMQIHYEKHHAAYTANLNNAIKGTELEGKPIEYILENISKYSPAIRNNGGGYFNHVLFWEILTPKGSKEINKSLEIAKKIDEYFGSFDEFKKVFSSAAATQFGSGWAWLSVDDNGKLFVSSTPNQDNPLMDVVDKKGTPILALDVWEHAYYLNYQNRRVDYIESFFNIIDWDYVNEKYLSTKN